MGFPMSPEPKSENGPAGFVISESQTALCEPEKKSRATRKLLVITGGVVLGILLVLASILVGMHMFTEAQKEIMKYSLQLNQNMKQDVTSNPNTNTVQFHVQEKDQEVWVVNDYNADISCMKIQSATQTNCYVTPLNESNPNNLPKIQPNTTFSKTADTTSLVYTTGASPILDTSFLSKAARDQCKGISTYWLYPRCESLEKDEMSNLTAETGDRTKRTPIVCLDNGYCYYYYYYAYCGCYSNNFFFSLGYFRYTCVYQYPFFRFTVTQWSHPFQVFQGTKRC